MRGRITEVQRFCVHDGPGIRTVVFLKGCNLRCRWCHNPETISAIPQLQTYPERCIDCRECVRVCASGAQSSADGRRTFHRERCRACGACAGVCYAQALVMAGREIEARDVADEAAEDRPFYERSGGGVTLSGGEPLLQPDFAAELLERCRSAGIQTAIETNLAWPWERVTALLPLTDLVMADVKTWDNELHRRWTGAGNGQVIENIRRLAECGKPLIARTPLVGGVNDTPAEVGRIAELLAGARGLMYYELLPYHPLGRGKYQSLGMGDEGQELAAPPRERVAELAEEARSRGIAVLSRGSP